MFMIQILRLKKTISNSPLPFLFYDKNGIPIYAGDKNAIYDEEPKSKSLSFLGYAKDSRPIYDEESKSESLSFLGYDINGHQSLSFLGYDINGHPIYRI